MAESSIRLSDVPGRLVDLVAAAAAGCIRSSAVSGLRVLVVMVANLRLLLLCRLSLLIYALVYILLFCDWLKLRRRSV